MGRLSPGACNFSLEGRNSPLAQRGMGPQAGVLLPSEEGFVLLNLLLCPVTIKCAPLQLLGVWGSLAGARRSEAGQGH